MMMMNDSVCLAKRPATPWYALLLWWGQDVVPSEKKKHANPRYACCPVTLTAHVLLLLLGKKRNQALQKCHT